MPWKSAKQRRWAYANKPKMAREWDHKYGTKPRKKKTRKKK